MSAARGGGTAAGRSRLRSDHSPKYSWQRNTSRYDDRARYDDRRQRARARARHRPSAPKARRRRLPRLLPVAWRAIFSPPRKRSTYDLTQTYAKFLHSTHRIPWAGRWTPAARAATVRSGTRNPIFAVAATWCARWISSLFFLIITCTHTHRGEGGRWEALGCTHSGSETKRADTHRARTFVSEDRGEPVCHRVRSSLDDRHSIVGRIVRVSPIEDASPTGAPGMRLRSVAFTLRYRRGYREKMRTARRYTTRDRVRNTSRTLLFA